MNLPKQAGSWTRSDLQRRVTADTIFNYMDGGGELYLGYAFDHLDVIEYATGDRAAGTILVEVYSMASSADAFGLLSTDWTGEPIALGPGPGGGVATVPPNRALYGAGLLRLWSGSVYARVLASRDTPAARDAVLAIGRALATGTAADPPDLVGSLPITAAVGPNAAGKAGRPIRADRTCFLRSHLVLNSQYFLSSQDILNLGRDVAAATTEYAPARPDGRPLRLIVVRYPTPAAAAAAADAFRRGYLPEAAGRGEANDGGAVRTEHGWVAWAVRRQGIAIVLDADDKAAARVLADRAAGAQAPDGQHH